MSNEVNVAVIDGHSGGHSEVPPKRAPQVSAITPPQEPVLNIDIRVARSASKPERTISLRLSNKGKIADYVVKFAKAAFPEGLPDGGDTPAYWAAEYLHLPISSAESFLLAVDTSSLASKDRNLARAAAAYAWILKSTDPKYAAQGSLKHDLEYEYTDEQRTSWINATAQHVSHSNAIEGAAIDRNDLQKALNQAFNAPTN